MSLHYDLPVYKASYDLLLEIFKFTKDFSKEYKYTIGEKLKNETTDLITNIYRANSVYQKKEIIQKAREHTEVIRLFMRLLKDLHEVNIKKFVTINEKIENWNILIRKNKKLSRAELRQFQSSINSYLGIMKHYKTYKIRKKMLLKNVSAWVYNQVYISGGYSKLVNKIKYQ